MKKTIFKTQMFIYMGILLISFGIFGVAISYYYTQLNMKEQERTLILQGERFKESMSSLYYTGAMDVARMGFEIQIMESYMDASVFFMNSNGKISLVSKSLNENWIGETITDEAVSIVLGGNVATVIGKVGGMFNETVLTVGYPIIIGNQTLGGVFMCKSLLTVEKEANDTIKIIFSAMLPVIIIGVTLTYFSTRRISLPLQNMNAVAKVIADGNFENRIEVDSEDEVGQLAQSFNYMAENLEKIENNRRKFTANISHDLRSPLTSIQGFISAMSDGTIPPENHQKYFNIVLEETARLAKLANDMTDLSKMEAGAIKLELCQFDINEVIRDSLNSFETRLKGKKLNTNALFAEEITVVEADPHMIQRVIQNLLDNAIKFTPENGYITVETTKDGEKINISVRDSGEGISQEEQRKVFERFFKADSSRGTDKTGVGLGLSIVKEFIKAHGETIDVKSQQGVGTEFVFTLKTIDISDV